MIKITESKKNAIDYNNEISPYLMESLSPLQALGISSFGFVRIFMDGKWLVTGSNKQWVAHFIDQIKFNKNYQLAIANEIHKKYKYVTYANCKDDLDIESYSRLLDYELWSGMNIYDVQKKYIDYYYFLGGTKNPLDRSFFIDNLNLIERFINYFKIKYQGLINTRDCDVLIELNNPINIESALICEKNEKIKRFIQQTEIHEYPLIYNQYKINLTKRQFDCLYYYSFGDIDLQMIISETLYIRFIAHKNFIILLILIRIKTY